MKRSQIKKTKGILCASSVAFMQGCEGILFVLLGIIFLKSTFKSFGFAVGSLAIKELITLGMIFLFVSPKRIGSLMKMLKTRKELRFFLYAGVFGTTIGNLSYIIAIQLAGAAYGVVLTSLYPIFAIILNNIFFASRQHKENMKVWIGVLISVVGAILFIVLPSIISHNSFSTHTIIGIIMGGCAGMFWSIEGLLLNKGISKRINKDIKTIDATIIRSFAAVMSTCCFLLPLSTTMHYLNADNQTFYNPLLIIKDILINWRAFLIIFAIGLNIAILRNVHLIAIKLIGAKLTAIIDTNNFLVTPLFSAMLVYINLTFINSTDPLFVQLAWWSWLLIIPIIIGVMIVLFYRHKTRNEEFEKVI